MNKFPRVSNEISNDTGKIVRTTSQIPYDKYDCECRPLVEKYFELVAQGQKPTYVKCLRKDKKAKFYEIVCKNCGHIVATCWSTDKQLTDFYDLHYVCENDGKNWFGAFSLNLSPIDGKLGIECSCGQDTRDFRANNTLPLDQKIEKILENKIGSAFGTASSKFELREVK